MAGHRKLIAVLPGDGIGPEVTRAATGLLQNVADEFGHQFTFAEFPAGGAGLDLCGSPLPEETLEGCRRADAVLLGAVGGPKWDSLPLESRPEAGLLELRRQLGLYINLRPTMLRKSLRDISPLRPARSSRVDFEIVRELAGGIYFGEHRTEASNGFERASDLEVYSVPEIERVARYALERAASRSQRLTSVDKANVLASSALWRKTVSRLAAGYPAVTLQHMYVDNAAMQLVLAPGQFDVILTSNMFGDILSDAAAALVGSIGLVPSMSCGTGTPLFEPIHGSAPALAGRDCACPVGAILSACMMLSDAFSMREEAQFLEAAVEHVLARGFRTPDIAAAGDTIVGCSQFVAQVQQEFRHSFQQLEPYGWGV